MTTPEPPAATTSTVPRVQPPGDHDPAAPVDADAQIRRLRRPDRRILDAVAVVVATAAVLLVAGGSVGARWYARTSSENTARQQLLDLGVHLSEPPTVITRPTGRGNLTTDDQQPGKAVLRYSVRYLDGAQADRAHYVVARAAEDAGWKFTTTGCPGHDSCYRKGPNTLTVRSSEWECATGPCTVRLSITAPRPSLWPLADLPASDAAA
ncbi:hypothetical protein AB0M43_37240 [Longispora sp. NPDC051575]|uniref:hypothetical protein n=1 Tax=Longispora sp. NPDC051575 TaxID=3154943 RepID=UPI0034244AB5